MSHGAIMEEIARTSKKPQGYADSALRYRKMAGLLHDYCDHYLGSGQLRPGSGLGKLKWLANGRRRETKAPDVKSTSGAPAFFRG
jgi:hypothetical protein